MKSNLNLKEEQLIEILDDEEYRLLQSFLLNMKEGSTNPIDIIKFNYRKLIIKKRLNEIEKQYYKDIIKDSNLRDQNNFKPGYQKLKKPILQQR